MPLPAHHPLHLSIDMAIQNSNPTSNNPTADRTGTDSTTERAAPLMFSPTSLVKMGLFDTEAPQEPR